MCKGLVVEESAERPKMKTTVTRLGRAKVDMVQDEAEREMGSGHKEFLWPTVFYFLIES